MVVPFVAVNSASVSLIPLTYTSRNPTVYAKLNVVCPEDAVKVCLVLSDGNEPQVSPLPVDCKYSPLLPVEPPALRELSN